MLYIVGGKVLTMTGQTWERGYLCIDNGKIRELGSMRHDCPLSFFEKEGAQVINAENCVIMPGIIDAHCHLGIMEQNMGSEGNDCNESAEPVTPWLRAIDGINPLDPSFYDAAAAGITSVMTGPGSSNVVGGQFVFMKTVKKKGEGFTGVIDDLIVKFPAAMKIAFGENVKANFSEKGISPVTRMAIAGCLREELFKARQYCEGRRILKKTGEEIQEEDFRYECWLPVFEKRIPLKAHAHRADDILTAIRIAKEFDLNLTLDHVTEGGKIIDDIQKCGYPAIWGPGLGSRHKIELKDMNFDTMVQLNQAGVKTAIMTDHPVSLIQTLPMCAAFSVKRGLSLEEALKSITIYPAQICGVSDRVGSLEVGKDADIVILSGNPLETLCEVKYTMIDGQIVYQV